MILIFVAFVYIFINSVNVLTPNQKLSDVNNTQISPTPTETLTPTPTPTQTPLFSGKIKELDKDLEIFKKDFSFDENTHYYEAGQFSRGELKDYFRVIAMSSGSDFFTLATKDYKTYILDDSKKTKDPYYFLNKEKISETKTFDTEQPTVIQLNQNLALYGGNFAIKIVDTGEINSYKSKLYKKDISTEFSSYQKLSTPLPSLKIYFKPYEINQEDFKHNNSEFQERVLLEQKYIIGKTTFIITDSTGLPREYSLTTKKAIDTYNENMLKVEPLQTEKSGFIIFPPTMIFKKAEIETPNNLQFFNSYRAPLPEDYKDDFEAKVFNVKDEEMEQIGMGNNVPLYRLKDKNHQLYKMEFQYKIIETPEGSDGSKGTKPTLDQYIEKNPLLFVKDYWNRWIGLGEGDFHLLPKS